MSGNLPIVAMEAVRNAGRQAHVPGQMAIIAPSKMAVASAELTVPSQMPGDALCQVSGFVIQILGTQSQDRL